MRHKKVNRVRWAIVKRYAHGAEQVVRIGFYSTKASLIKDHLTQSVQRGLTWRQAKTRYNLRCVRVTLVWQWS